MSLDLALPTFVEESRELLRDMEGILLGFESDGIEGETLHALFRTAHTIKGSAGLFGLVDIVQFTHVVESVLDRLRNSEISAAAELINLLLNCRDHIAVLVDIVAAGGTCDAAEREQGAALASALDAFLDHAAAPPDAPASTPAPADGSISSHSGERIGPDHWHLSLRFGPDVLRMGMDPLAFIRFLGTLGSIVHLETVFDPPASLESYDPERCHLGFEIDFHTEASKQEIESVFEFVRDDAQIRILPPHSRIDDYIALIRELPEDMARLGDILVAGGTLTPQELERALQIQARERNSSPEPDPRRIGEILVDSGAVAPPVVAAALEKQRRNQERRASEARSVKVPADRLDALIDLVGEVVIAGAAAQLAAGRSRQPALVEATSHLLRLVEDIRDGALRLRMVQIGEVFSRFPRVVRDVSRELGKEIDLRITGAETELDKFMVERIGDPLMHLVRNAIDHAIEPPEARLAAGKPAIGRLSLNAYHESGSIVIEVRDDGRGLDCDRILRKAVEKGLVSPEQTLSTAEIHRLILEPGFSTADAVTNLSGRGVGMDVVKSNVEALRGTLDIESRPWAGTCMRICLPLTLAIIDGFLVTVGASVFIVPLDMVVECIELPPKQAESESCYLNLRGEALPFLRLDRLFEQEHAAAARRNVVVIKCAGRKAGLAVNQLLGQFQTVIKPLGRLFERVRGIAGSTILGSGEVALILDVPQLVQIATDGEARRLHTVASP